MQKQIFTFLALFFMSAVLSTQLNAQTTVSIYCTGSTGSYNSGSVNSTGNKYDGNIDSVSFGAAAPYFPVFRGWAEFDLSSLPVGATITNVSLYFTTYNGTQSSGASNPITGFIGDASTMTASTLYNAIASGTSLAATIWSANGLQTASLGTAGNTFIQNNLGSSINVGFQRAGYLPYFIYGYPGATADQPRLDITFNVTTPCSSITSVTATGPSTTCAGNSFTLSSATLPYAAGYDFQWESSPASANTWTTINGATSSSYLTTQTSATDYRVVVTCPATSSTMTSNVVAVAQTNFNNCYCPATVSYISNEDITNVTLGVINNSTSCGSVTGSQGTATGGADIYSNFTASTVPVPTLMLGTTQSLSVTLNTCSGTSNVRECMAYIDYNQNGLFTDPGEDIVVYAAANPSVIAYVATVPISIPSTATLGNTRMRIILSQGTTTATTGIMNPCQVLNTYGEVEDYTVNIAAVVNCTGTPTAGTISGPNTICNNSNFSLSATGASTANGIAYQWQTSPSGNLGTWTDIIGASTANLSTTQTGPNYYRMYATCTNNTLGDTSAGHLVSQSTFYTCYCASGAVNSFYSDITNVTVGILNNTSNCNTVAPGPGSIQGRYANYTSGVGIPATPQLTHSFPVTFSVDITECNAFGVYSGTAIFIDYDQSGTFDAGELAYGNPAYQLGNHTVNGSFTMPSTSLSGITGMRVVNQYYVNGNAATPCNNSIYAGETEDYLIDIVAPPNCSGNPTAGTVTSNVPDVCASVNDTVRFTVTGSSATAGVIYQWQSSPTGTPGSWVDITGANGIDYKTVQSSATYYRMFTLCAFSGGTDTTNALLIDMSPFYYCYCSPKTGTTLHTCCGNYISNVSISGTTLNNSSTTAGPGYYTQYTDATTSQTADLTQTGPYTLSVTIPNSGYGADVWIDFDQSGSFDATEYFTFGSMTSAGQNTLSTTIVIPSTATPGLTGMRVRHWYTSYGSSGACTNSTGYETEDYVVTILAAPSCSSTPATTVASAPSEVCNGSNFTLNATGYSIGSGIIYEWESSPTGTNSWVPVASSSLPTLSTTQTSATDYRFVTTCVNTPSNNTSYSNVVTVNMSPFYSCYTPSSANNTSDEEIYSVTVNGGSTAAAYAGASGCSTPAPGNGSMLSRYSNFTSLPPITTLPQGTTGIPYTITEDECDGATYFLFGAAMFIDFDQDGVFGNNTNEVILQEPTTTAGPRNITGTFDVPMTAVLGLTGMRIIVAENISGSTLTPGLTYGYGETEDFVVNIGNPLAIKLDKISAVNLGSTNRIDWSTLSEEKTDYFELERSADARNFSKIAELKAKGEAGNYSYIDYEPSNGINYYRLKMVNNAGIGVYSKVVSATVQKDFIVEAYPNPVSDHLTVITKGIQGNEATIQITDVTGKTLTTLTAVSNVTTIDMKGFANGIYLIKYSDNNRTQTIKINKQ